MKYSEIKNNKKDSLFSTYADLKKELFNLRMQKAEGKLEKTSRFRDCRRDVARVLTRLSELKRTQ